MALSDCEKCWNTPCDCGWDYRSWSINSLNDLIGRLTTLRDMKVEAGEDPTKFQTNVRRDEYWPLKKETRDG